MSTPAHDPRAEDAPPSFAVFAHTRASRAVANGLLALAAVNVLYLGASLAGDFLNGTNNAPPVPVAVGLALFTGLPLVLLIALNRAVAGAVSVDKEALVLSLRRERVEIPLASVARVFPLRLPAPMPGVVIQLRSGRIFERTLGTRSFMPLYAALAAHAVHDNTAMFDFADVLPQRRSRLLLGVKHVALPLALTLVIFRLHQIIAYGGPFGQYHSMGLGPYLASFFQRWLGIAGSFLVMAGVLRVLVEGLVWGLTWLWLTGAYRVRRAAEIASNIIYFSAIPGYVAVRLLLD